jgi:carboxyl-terminal processing protease
MRPFIELNRFDVFLLDVSLKAFVILGVAGCVSLFLSRYRSSAATNHAVWSLAIVSVLALPLMSAFLPTWCISKPWQKTASMAPGAPTAEPTADPLVLSWAQAEQFPAVQAVAPQASPLEAVATNEATRAAAQTSNRRFPNGADLPWIFIPWVLGACLTLAPALIGLISLRRLARSSRLVITGPLNSELQEQMDQLGMNCSMRLLVSPARSMPMTWGIWRPTILLPDEAESWSESRLRLVLVHELAHFVRRDCLTRLLAQIARAVYWFNPLAWLAERQLRTLQEQACDDVVLNRGHSATDYAEQLLTISAGYRSPICAAGLALAMARAAKLERRLLLILDPNQNRRAFSRRWTRFAGLATVILLSVVSVLRFDATAAEAQVAQLVVEKTQPASTTGQPTEHSKTLAELRAKITEQYLTPVDVKLIEQGAIKGMIAALNDPYSDYLTPDMVAEMEKQIRGTLVGIGAQLEKHDGQIRVVTPLEDSPALKAGLQPGDVILQIDGNPTAGIELTEAVKRIVGQQGTVVRLNIGREGGQEVEMNITRDSIKVPTVRGFQRRPDNRWSFVLDPDQTTGYVQLAQLGAATPQELRAALESLKAQGLKGLILDLRFCPGGMLESAVAVSKLFLNDGTIVTIHGRDSEPTPIKVDAPAALGDFPLIVLVNGDTASAAEIVAGALQDNHRALVLGTRTLGKGSVQTLIKLEADGGAIKLTTSEYRLPSGRNIDRRPGEESWGINPDDGYFVPLDQAQSKTLLERRQTRDIIGKRAEYNASSTEEVTAEWIESQQSDPQLAAALRTMAARLENGQFTTVSNVTADEIKLFLKREDVERRRMAVLQDLEQLNRELAAIGKQAVDN